ncbi:putative permease [Phaeobacter inhibens]|uniref:Permease n=1 Tax=Phaeobacter inhibens TaxID=221822 RepID=A0ABN5GJH4_9RHOB|nr:DMT family transporter [Phaeobacter inhibens]AUQ49013.1 putative permease [Phaeobacter inhibens]AUQ93513.1 putative permease [Phaeobacter inhibens]AUR18816.1 putative permease [Phaeobacter inhibens]
MPVTAGAMVRAVMIMFVAMSMIPAGDLCGKLLTSGGLATPGFVAWSRFAIGTVLVLPFAWRGAWPLFADWRLWLRAALLSGGILSIQIALKTEPLADVFAAFFIGPIVSYVLSVLLLREAVTPARSLLMALGFCGVLLVVRPGLGGSANLIWAAAAGVCYGGFLTSSRWLSHLGTPLQLSLTQLSISALLTLPLGLAALPAPSLPTAALTFGSAGFSMLGNLLLLFAYAQAPASRLAPLIYFQLIAAVSLGWWVLDQWPDALTWAGLAVVIGAGLLSAGLRR